MDIPGREVFEEKLVDFSGRPGSERMNRGGHRGPSNREIPGRRFRQRKVSPSGGGFETFDLDTPEGGQVPTRLDELADLRPNGCPGAGGPGGAHNDPRLVRVMRVGVVGRESVLVDPGDMLV